VVVSAAAGDGVNPRNTGILVLVAAALGAFIWFYELGGEEARRQAEEQAKRLFPGVEQTAIDWIALETSDGREARIERRDGSWHLTQPLDFPADRSAIDGMAAALAQVTSEAAYDDPQPLAEYGLGDDARRVRFSAKGTEHAIRFGHKTPVGGDAYAAVEGNKTVYTVASWRAQTFNKALTDLRDKRILDFDRNAIERIELSWPEGGRVVLERSQPAAAGKGAEKGGTEAQAGEAAEKGREAEATEAAEAPATRWRIVSPIQGRADDDAVDDLLSDLSYLRANGFVDEPVSDADAGLDHPAFAAVLSGPAPAKDAKPVRVALAVGAPHGDKSRLVRGGLPTLYTIESDRLDDFPRKLVSYRYRTLARFAASDAHQVEFFYHPEGSDPVAITATRGADGWSAEPEAMAKGRMPRIVAELAHLRADDILAEEMGEKELRALGLSPPNTIITVLGKTKDADEGEAKAAEKGKASGASETGGEAEASGKAEEASPAPRLAEIQIGVVQNGKWVVARAAGDPTVYRLAYDFAQHVPVSLEAYRNRFRSADAAPKDAPEAAHAGGETPDFLPNAQESP
jgi:Domain of unknown function (DUF4340)